MDLTKVRVSDIKNNPRVILAKPRSVKEECELPTRLVMVQKIAEQYNVENPEGKQNLTSSEYRGYKRQRRL